MLSYALECKVKAPDISTVMLKSTQTSEETYSSMFLINLSPITVEGTKVNFNKGMMEVDKGYPFTYKNKMYIAIKTSETDIDIYRVKK